MIKNPPANAGDAGLIPELGRFSGEEFSKILPEKSHEQRSLADYHPLGRKRVGHDLVTKQHHHHHT